MDRLTQVNYPSVNASIPGYSEINQYDFTGNRTERNRTFPTLRSVNHADFNNDGKADVPWFLNSGRDMRHWYTSGAYGETVAANTLLNPNRAEAGWTPYLRADFNQDGVQDILAGNGDQNAI